MRAALAIAVLAGLTLTACGFQLRGPLELPFERLHLALPPQSELYALIKRQVESGSRTRITEQASDAEASLQVLSDEQSRDILSLSAAGRVREFQLQRTFRYRLVAPDGQELAPPAQIVLKREITFDDRLVLSKANEEALLQRDMQFDLAQQLLRRLAAVKLTRRPEGRSAH